ncbi:hypothetical protein FRX31_004336 [Thalictrum thalictroides]|uniref:Uncharacterized protein n=1 Tax=Thalictrum thalictroides TaxID=46969 RepID=A0A7J6X8W4_THATH|nr:hypothetical protein FRX31_004336 [Thalictrum thalictroides]
MIDNVSFVDNLDFIMESDALGHTVMDQRQGHESSRHISNFSTRSLHISHVPAETQYNTVEAPPAIDEECESMDSTNSVNGEADLPQPDSSQIGEECESMDSTNFVNGEVDLPQPDSSQIN